MKLEIGMYVRTKRGQIGKIITIGKDNVAIEFNKMWQDIILKENIIKASYNIIDLIEVGDYVNGMKIDYIYNSDFYGKTVCSEMINDCEVFHEENIKSIVTKEQFERMAYKVAK